MGKAWDKDEIKLGISKLPESQVNSPYISSCGFLEMSDPPIPEVDVRLAARLMAYGMEHLTTDNGDGTFTHSLVQPDPDWPNVVDDE